MDKNRVWQVVRFLAGGVIGVGLYYLILITLTEFLGVWYILSATFGFIFNWGSNFLIQKFWTFPNADDEGSSRRQFGLYFMMALGTLVVNNGLLFVLVRYAHLYYLLAQLMLSIAIAPLSFVLTRKIFATK